ncbi:hypothetical protein BC828DRAFT_396154 [Blastocladiella britannica]|nr:hypothetical protein BC828DRAFT_396154 [Blastocladiella britannica]
MNNTNMASSSSLAFAHVADFFDRIPGARTATLRESLLARLFSAVRARHDPREAVAVLRILLPMHDRLRGNYKLKESALADLLITSLNLAPTTDDAVMLKQWRNPGVAPGAGDFAGVAHAVIARRSTVPERPRATAANNKAPVAAAASLGPTVQQVDAQLEALVLAATATPDPASAQRGKIAVMHWIMANMTAGEAKWMLRLILKDLKLGISERTVLRAWHPAAYRLWTTSSDLSLVATSLLDPSMTLAEDAINIEPMVPFKPMLGFKADDFSALPARIADFAKPFYVQEKVDGERLTIHYANGIFKFYSRKSTVWDEYGTSFDASQSSWTRHVNGFFVPDTVTSFILDGEMVSIDSRTGEVLPFGTLRTAAKSNVHDRDHLAAHPKYFAFDLLHLNGTPLARLPLRSRLARMRTTFTNIAHWFELLSFRECTGLPEVVVELRRTYLSKGEGLVVKNPASLYFPGERPPCWLKVKLDYEIELMESLDLVVVGASWGEGDRGSRLLSQYLVAVRDTTQTTADGQPVWVTVAKVGSGYSRMQMEQIQEQIEDHMSPWTVGATPPDWLRMVNRPNRAKPDVLIHPTKSVVLSIVAAELTASDEYATGATLRFPRVHSIRRDLGPSDTMKLADLEALWKRTNGRLIKEPSADLFDPVKQKERRALRLRRAATVAGMRRRRAVYSKFIAVPPVPDTRQIFEGRSFIVHIPTPPGVFPTRPSLPVVSRAAVGGPSTSKGSETSKPVSELVHLPLDGQWTTQQLVTAISQRGGTCLAGLPRDGGAKLKAEYQQQQQQQHQQEQPSDPSDDIASPRAFRKRKGATKAKTKPNTITAVAQPTQLIWVSTDTRSAAVADAIHKNGRFDVVHARHIAHCATARRWTSPRPEDFLYMTPETRALYHTEYCVWGDSNTEPLTSNDEVRRLLAHMDVVQMQVPAPPRGDEDGSMSTTAPSSSTFSSLRSQQHQQPRACTMGQTLFAMPYAGVDRDDRLSRPDPRVDDDSVRAAITADRRAKLHRIHQLRARYCNEDPLPLRWFSGLVVYPHWYESVGSVDTIATKPPPAAMQRAVAQLIMYGAEVVSDLLLPCSSSRGGGGGATHILVHPTTSIPTTAEDPQGLAPIVALGIIRKVVSADWVARCCREKTLLMEDSLTW